MAPASQHRGTLPGMPTIAVCGQKGGTGKTTIATNVAGELVARGYRVLLVDADPQRSASTWKSVGEEHRRAVPSVLLVGAEMHRGQIAAVARGFDVTVIDCPPAIAAVQASALMVADLALIPCAPPTFDAWALDGSLKLAQDAQRVRRPLRVAVVINRRKSGTVIGDQARAVFERAGAKVLKTELRDRLAYQEAPAAGIAVTIYQPSSKAADEVRALVDEIIALAGVRHGSNSKHKA